MGWIELAVEVAVVVVVVMEGSRTEQEEGLGLQSLSRGVGRAYTWVSGVAGVVEEHGRRMVDAQEGRNSHRERHPQCMVEAVSVQHGGQTPTNDPQNVPPAVRRNVRQVQEKQSR